MQREHCQPSADSNRCLHNLLKKSLKCPRNGPILMISDSDNKHQVLVIKRGNYTTLGMRTLLSSWVQGFSRLKCWYRKSLLRPVIWWSRLWQLSHNSPSFRTIGIGWGRAVHSWGKSATEPVAAGKLAPCHVLCVINHLIWPRMVRFSHSKEYSLHPSHSKEYSLHTSLSKEYSLHPLHS